MVFELAPQAGPPDTVYASSADIISIRRCCWRREDVCLVIGVASTQDVRGFGAVIFRHNYNQITAEGGLWDASYKIFGQIPDAHSRKSPELHWRFDGGAKLSFAHIERDEDLKIMARHRDCLYRFFDELNTFHKTSVFCICSLETELLVAFARM